MLLWLVLGVHVAGIAAMVRQTSTRARPIGRAVFALAAAPALFATVVSALWLSGRTPLTTRVEWVEGLDLVLALRLDALSALLGLVVAGIGVLVELHCRCQSRY
jgi:multicomponent Na+:H+ antiporter subunit A